MGSRVIAGTARPDPIAFTFDGATLTGHPGETIAAALIASNIVGFRRDLHGRLRGPYCNMGTCFECLLQVRAGGSLAVGPARETEESWRTVRACLTPVAAGMEVRSRSSAGGTERSER